jgi:hypothetical protein
MRKALLLLSILCFASFLVTAAHADTITFEGLPDITIITNQYLGVTCSNPVVMIRYDTLFEKAGENNIAVQEGLK